MLLIGLNSSPSGLKTRWNSYVESRRRERYKGNGLKSNLEAQKSLFADRVVAIGHWETLNGRRGTLRLACQQDPMKRQESPHF